MKLSRLLFRWASFDPDSYLIMLTHEAYIKKVQMSDFANIRRSGIIAITLNEGDELGWVRPSWGKSDVIIGTGDGMCIRYSEEELRPLGRTARGCEGHYSERRRQDSRLRRHRI
jgi:DNA gyrase subunit A